MPLQASEDRKPFFLRIAFSDAYPWMTQNEHSSWRYSAVMNHSPINIHPMRRDETRLIFRESCALDRSGKDCMTVLTADSEFTHDEADPKTQAGRKIINFRVIAIQCLRRITIRALKFR
jgi:hypothetical protein